MSFDSTAARFLLVGSQGSDGGLADGADHRRSGSPGRSRGSISPMEISGPADEESGRRAAGSQRQSVSGSVRDIHARLSAAATAALATVTTVPSPAAPSALATVTTVPSPAAPSALATVTTGASDKAGEEERPVYLKKWCFRLAGGLGAVMVGFFIAKMIFGAPSKVAKESDIEGIDYIQKALQDSPEKAEQATGLCGKYAIPATVAVEIVKSKHFDTPLLRAQAASLCKHNIKVEQAKVILMDFPRPDESPYLEEAADLLVKEPAIGAQRAFKIVEKLLGDQPLQDQAAILQQDHGINAYVAANIVQEFKTFKGDNQKVLEQAVVQWKADSAGCSEWVGGLHATKHWEADESRRLCGFVRSGHSADDILSKFPSVHSEDQKRKRSQAAELCNKYDISGYLAAEIIGKQTSQQTAVAAEAHMVAPEAKKLLDRLIPEGIVYSVPEAERLIKDVFGSADWAFTAIKEAVRAEQAVKACFQDLISTFRFEEDASQAIKETEEVHRRDHAIEGGALCKYGLNHKASHNIWVRLPSNSDYDARREAAKFCRDHGISGRGAATIIKTFPELKKQPKQPERDQAAELLKKYGKGEKMGNLDAGDACKIVKSSLGTDGKRLEAARLMQDQGMSVDAAIKKANG